MNTRFVFLFFHFLLACLPFCSLGAQEQGIRFMDYKECTMDDVLKQAQSEQKCIFVDIWTPWCGVCKMMDRYIFPRKDVGELFNRRFINLSFDAEHAAWADVAQNFNATAYPTMLIVNPQGEVIWNIDNLGIPRADDLERDRSEVADRLMQQAVKAEALLSMPDETFVGQENWAYLRREQPAFDTQVFDRIVRLQDTLSVLYPDEFRRLVNGSLGQAAANMMMSVDHRPVPNTHKMEQYKDVVSRLRVPYKNSLLLDMEITVGLRMRDWEKALQLASAQEEDMTPLLYATMMDELANGCTDRQLLRRAVEVTGKVFQTDLSQKEKDMLDPAYRQLLEAAGMPAR